jgi:hypothetical protein
MRPAKVANKIPEKSGAGCNSYTHAVLMTEKDEVLRLPLSGSLRMTRGVLSRLSDLVGFARFTSKNLTVRDKSSATRSGARKSSEFIEL